MKVALLSRRKNSLVPVDYGVGDFNLRERIFDKKASRRFQTEIAAPDIGRGRPLGLVHPGRFRARGVSRSLSLLPPPSPPPSTMDGVVTRGLILRETAEAGGSAGIMCDSNHGIIL